MSVDTGSCLSLKPHCMLYVARDHMYLPLTYQMLSVVHIYTHTQVNIYIINVYIFVGDFVLHSEMSFYSTCYKYIPC